MIQAMQFNKVSQFLDNHAKSIFVTMLVTLALLAMFDVAAATTTGTEFQAAYDRLEDWLTGYLGKIVALLFIGVGVFMGIKAQSLWGVAVGIGFAMAVVEAPGIIDSVFSVSGISAADLAEIAIAPAA